MISIQTVWLWSHVRANSSKMQFFTKCYNYLDILSWINHIHDHLCVICQFCNDIFNQKIAFKLVQIYRFSIIWHRIATVFHLKNTTIYLNIQDVWSYFQLHRKILRWGSYQRWRGVHGATPWEISHNRLYTTRSILWPSSWRASSICCERSHPCRHMGVECHIWHLCYLYVLSVDSFVTSYALTAIFPP